MFMENATRRQANESARGCAGFLRAFPMHERQLCAAEGRPLTLDVLLKKRGQVIGDEPGNTDSDPGASEKAVSEGEAGKNVATRCSREAPFALAANASSAS
jgi:hypothetical protein